MRMIINNNKEGMIVMSDNIEKINEILNKINKDLQEIKDMLEEYAKRK